MTIPRDNQQDLDRLLDKDSGDLGDLYRRLPRMEPPRRLDRAVLGEAARAVRGRPSRRHRWIVGLGSAAGLVLAAGVAWQVGQDALRQQSADSAQHGMIVVPIEPITESTLRKRERANNAQNAAAAPAQAQAPSPTPASAPAPPAKPSLARKPASNSPTSPPAVLAPPSPPPAAPELEPQSVPFPAKTKQRAESPAPAAAAGVLIAPSDKALEAKEARASDELDEAMPIRSRSSVPPSLSGSVELRRDMQLSPDDWLAHIEQLMRQGRRQQAVDSLHLFRRMHPDLPVPGELGALED